MAILVIEACRTAAETMVHGRVKVLDLAFFYWKGATGAMETRWPFGGFFFFFLKIADEREGTHLYDDYQKELAEAPVTEDEEKEHRESAQAVLAELERLNIADEQRRKERYYPLSVSAELTPCRDDTPQDGSRNRRHRPRSCQ